MRYKVILIPSDEGVSVSCPGLPGCWSQGENEEEALENISDAIQEYLVAINQSLEDTEDTRIREVEVSVE